MKLYNARVRLSGSVNNEVNKEKLTAAEIVVLQRAHGGVDAVVDIKEIGSTTRSDRKERARLVSIYTAGPAADGKTRLEGPAFIDSIFGAGAPLPKEYVAPEVDEPEVETLADTEEKEEETLMEKPVAVVPRRTRVPRADESAAQLTA